MFSVRWLRWMPRPAKQAALTEMGAEVNGRGDTPNMHDILTGSSPDGRAVVSDKDTTCGNWTRGGDGSAIVGTPVLAGTTLLVATRGGGLFAFRPQ